MSDGPIFTGPVQMQLSGDVDVAKGHIHEGRRALGRLLAVHGAGAEGGFFKSVRQLDDGTRVTAITNNGHHLVRIETPPKQTVQPFEGEHHSAASPVFSGRYHVEGGNDSPPHDPPLPPPRYRETEEPGEEEKKDRTDYMWVGCRYTTPDVPWNILGAMMIEPDTGPQYGDSGNPKRGILDAIGWWVYDTIRVNGSEGEFSIDPDPYYVQDIDYAIGTQFDAYYNDFGGHQADEFDRAEQHVVEGTHAIPVQVNDNDGEFLISANGLRCESINLHAETDSTLLLGYDPYAEDQSGAGVRNVGDRHTSSEFGHIPQPPVLWDVVFTCDPHEDEQQMPVEKRPEMLAIRRLLEKEAGMVTQLLPGEYILALHAMDTDPQLRSTRAGEVIPIYAGETYGYRSAYSDYDEYMHPFDVSTPIDVDIEVRLGKGDSASTFNFTTTIAEGSYENSRCYPYGYDWREACDWRGGPNPAGPNFAPQYLAIDPLGGSARWIDHDAVDLYPILGGGQFTHKDDPREPLDVYFYIYGPSQPEQEEYAEYMAAALFEVLEAATAGIYGDMLMKDPGGEAGLQAMLAGLSKSVIWKWDPYTGSITSVPNIGDPDDYPYGPQDDGAGGTFMSPYVEPMAWYYPYKILSKDACRNSLGIGITAVKGTYFFENGQVEYYLDPPPNPECC